MWFEWCICPWFVIAWYVQQWQCKLTVEKQATLSWKRTELQKNGNVISFVRWTNIGKGIAAQWNSVETSKQSNNVLNTYRKYQRFNSLHKFWNCKMSINIFLWNKLRLRLMDCIYLTISIWIWNGILHLLVKDMYCISGNMKQSRCIYSCQHYHSCRNRMLMSTMRIVFRSHVKLVTNFVSVCP